MTELDIVVVLSVVAEEILVWNGREAVDHADVGAIVLQIEGESRLVGGAPIKPELTMLLSVNSRRTLQVQKEILSLFGKVVALPTARYHTISQSRRRIFTTDSE